LLIRKLSRSINEIPADFQYFPEQFPIPGVAILVGHDTLDTMGQQIIIIIIMTFI